MPQKEKQAFSFDACNHMQTHWHMQTKLRVLLVTCKRSSSCLLDVLAYEVKPTIALALLELEDRVNSGGTINKYFYSHLAQFSILG